MNTEEYNPEFFEALERPKIALTESNMRDKRKYEGRRFDALYAKFNAHKGSPPKNYAHFAQNWGDVDIGYGSYINE